MSWEGQYNSIVNTLIAVNNRSQWFVYVALCYKKINPGKLKTLWSRISWKLFEIIQCYGVESIISAHWGRNKIVEIMQTAFSNTVSWGDLVVFYSNNSDTTYVIIKQSEQVWVVAPSKPFLEPLF